MNKVCSRCEKVVYPIEELKCLDKTWHKTCFKCTECGMTLNMKTYKGFNKSPYCEAHIPKAKATAIADTPELKRIAENTKIQSNVKYHADFEKAKGKFTQVADDPETLRIKQNTKIISNVAYHGDLEKKAAMEKQREAAEVAEGRDEAEYFSEQLAAEQFSQYGPSPSAVQQIEPEHYQQQPPVAQHQSNPTLYHLQHQHYQQQQQQLHQYQHYQQPLPIRQHPQQQHQMLQQQHMLKQTSHLYPGGATSAGGNYNIAQPQQQSPSSQYQQPHQLRSAIVHSSHKPTGGSASQHDISYSQVGGYEAQHQYESYVRPQSSNATAANNNHIPNSHSNSQIHHNTSNMNGVGVYHQQPQLQQKPLPPQVHQQMFNVNGQNNGYTGSGTDIGKIADYDPLTDGPRQLPSTGRQSTTLIYSSEMRGVNANNAVYPKRIGSISDIDPANGIYSSMAAENHMTPAQSAAATQHQLHSQQQKLRVYRAIYDYEAQDTDEVSFREDDVIYEVDSVDSGWMTGRVERTATTTSQTQRPIFAPQTANGAGNMYPYEVRRRALNLLHHLGGRRQEVQRNMDTWMLPYDDGPPQYQYRNQEQQQYKAQQQPTPAEQDFYNYFNQVF